METTTLNPSNIKIFTSLLKADFMVQWRNRRASVMTIIVPILILISWKGVADKLGGAFATSSALTMGLISIGIMGFANTTARNREKGIFQRLRVTPASTTQIMVSRVVIQIVQILIMAVCVFLVGYYVDGISLPFIGYILALLVSVLSGAVFLGLGLAIVGLISSAETVNSVTRLVYIGLVVIGAIGELGVLGDVVAKIVEWSPYGTVKDLLYAALQLSSANINLWGALIVSIAYMAVFSYMGIKWFKWSS